MLMMVMRTEAMRQQRPYISPRPYIAAQLRFIPPRAEEMSQVGSDLGIRRTATFGGGLHPTSEHSPMSTTAHITLHR